MWSFGEHELNSWYQMGRECTWHFVLGTAGKSHAAMHIWVWCMLPKAIFLPAVKARFIIWTLGASLHLSLILIMECSAEIWTRLTAALLWLPSEIYLFGLDGIPLLFETSSTFHMVQHCGKIPSAELPRETVLASLLLFLRNRLCTADGLRAFVLIRGVVMYVFSLPSLLPSTWRVNTVIIDRWSDGDVRNCQTQ